MVDIYSVISQLSDSETLKKVYHQHSDGESFPSQDALLKIVKIARSVIFPGYFGDSSVDSSNLQYHVGANVIQLSNLLKEQILCAFLLDDRDHYDNLVKRSEEITSTFIERLPAIRELLITDVEAAYNGDPAAKSFSEIILCYPAIKAISNYRIAHELLVLGVPLVPRMISEMAHSETGIDIHPGATIGSYFTIDHGTGVVIGETCIIGHHVKLYQGVTLGAKSFQLDEHGNPVKNVPRHPIIEDNVVIYANATVLGRITVGEGAVIGGNLWVTQNVEKGGKVVQFKPTR